MIKALLRCLRLERLFERWLGMRGGDFEGRIYEALWVGCVLGFAAGAPKALEDLPGKEILQRLNGVFEALDRDLQRIANELEQALACADEGVASVRTEWETRKKDVQSTYEKILLAIAPSRRRNGWCEFSARLLRY